MAICNRSCCKWEFSAVWLQLQLQNFAAVVRPSYTLAITIAVEKKKLCMMQVVTILLINRVLLVALENKKFTFEKNFNSSYHL